MTGLEVSLMAVLAACFVGSVAGVIRWSVRRHIERVDALEKALPELVTETDMNLRIGEVLQQISALRAEGSSGDQRILGALGDFRAEQNREIGALRGELGAAHRRMDNLFRAPPSSHQ